MHERCIRCESCGREYPPRVSISRCESCGSSLEVMFDYTRLRKNLSLSGSSSVLQQVMLKLLS